MIKKDLINCNVCWKFGKIITTNKHIIYLMKEERK